MEAVVTIGLPVRQDIESFRQAVQSVYSQTFENWKLIIICDGASADIVELATLIDDKRVEVIVDTNNLGLPYRLNQITQMATTKYVARMDADDIMLRTRIQKQLDYLHLNENVDVLGTGSYLIDQNTVLRGSYKEPEIPFQPSGYLKNGIFAHPSVIFRRDWALLNPYDDRWVRTEDKELWLRTFATSTFCKLSDRLMLIRVPETLSYSKVAITSKFNRRLIRLHGPRVASRAEWFKCLVVVTTKQYVFRLLQFCGLDIIIYNGKQSRLEIEEFSLIVLEIQEIVNTVVPGWSKI